MEQICNVSCIFHTNSNQCCFKLTSRKVSWRERSGLQSGCGNSGFLRDFRLPPQSRWELCFSGL